MKLRDYQQHAIDQLWQFFRSRKGDGQVYHPLVVAPTGSGKSIIIAAIIRDCLERFGGLRVLVVTHQKELLEQDYDKIMQLYPECMPGLYSASLKRKETNNKVIFAGIQSVYKKAHELGDFSLMLIDEAHLIPNKSSTMYRAFIDDLTKYCGKVPIIGLTATPYRLDSGMLHQGENALFTDIAHEISINELMDKGYLSPVTTKATGFTIDASSVKKRGGEFVTADLAKLVDPLTEGAIADALPRINERNSIIVFCVTVEHAHHVSRVLNNAGVTCEAVDGGTPKAERERLLKAFKSGEIRALSSVGILTTGFDAPNTDCIIMLRPTESPGLYVQMIGRGMRISDGKYNCLVLDYAGNIERHGPVDCINVRTKKKGTGDAPVKTCPSCDSIVHASLRECPDCGHQFPPPELKIEHSASHAAVLSRDYEPEWRSVDEVIYSRHKGKDGKPDTMRVDYYDNSGLFPVRIASEFICIFHPLGYAREKAKQWCFKRGMTLETAQLLADGLYEYDPYHTEAILVDARGKYASIVDYALDKDLIRNNEAA